MTLDEAVALVREVKACVLDPTTSREEKASALQRLQPLADAIENKTLTTNFRGVEMSVETFDLLKGFILGDTCAKPESM